uniref:WGS project CBMI000000000 data, contig CS3069_c004618 n=1 Tax=Fusarium clavum TaxID=2594811 RepID=A0A090MKN0_9HYPO|nr:unnamed protein product [Fusarium clavum]
MAKLFRLYTLSSQFFRHPDAGEASGIDSLQVLASHRIFEIRQLGGMAYMKSLGYSSSSHSEVTKGSSVCAILA